MTPTRHDESGNSVTLVFDQVQWLEQNAYRCHVALLPEDDGTISAIVLNLPGAGSCGDTEAEAIENVKDSIRGLIATYIEDGQPVPWQATSSFDEIPQGSKTLWILVNV